MSEAFGSRQVLSYQFVCYLLYGRKKLFLFPEYGFESFGFFCFLCLKFFTELLRMLKGEPCVPHHPVSGTFCLRLGSISLHYVFQILHIPLVSGDILLICLIYLFRQFVMLFVSDVIFGSVTLSGNKFHLGVFEHITRTDGYIITLVDITLGIVFVCISAKALLNPVIIGIKDIYQLIQQIHFIHIICGVLFVFHRLLVKILEICGVVFYSVKYIFRSPVECIFC